MSQRSSSSLFAASIVTALVLAPSGFAQQRQAPASSSAAMPAMSGHQGMPMPGGQGQQGQMPMSANHQEMMQSMERMNHDMMEAPMTGDPDRDLVVMMMPHHQGAIDMARIYLRDGKDPAIRRMAQKIVADQEHEIRQFQAWLVKHPSPPR